ncbi:Hypothetical protein NocV09_07100110 [Nannochloropsis oceanica]
MPDNENNRDMPPAKSEGLGLEKLETEAASSSFPSSSSYDTTAAALSILKRCEARYKQEVLHVGRNLRTFFETHLDTFSSTSSSSSQAGSTATATDTNLGSLYSDYNLTIFSHSLIGGAFGYVLARAVTTRLAPSPRLFALVSFTGLSSMLAATAATTLATSDLVKKATQVVVEEKGGKEGGMEAPAWPYLIVCRPVTQLKECVQDGGCRRLLAGGKVEGGEGLLLAYKRCRARAEVWATQDEFLAMQEEEVGGKGGREEEDEDEEGRFMGEGDERFWGEGGMEGTRGENESRSNTNAGRKWQ